MLFGPGSLGIVFCHGPRVIPSRFSLRSASILASKYFSSSNYTLLKKVEKLEISIEAWPLFLLRSLSLRYAFYILSSLSFSLASSRALSIVSRGVSRDIIPARFLSFSLLPFLLLILLRSLPISVSTEIARHLGKQGSKQARHFKWRFLPLFLFPPLELLLASPCLSPSFSLSLHLYVTIIVICIAIV